MIKKSKEDIVITHGEAVPKEFGELDGYPAYDEFSKMMTRLPARALPTLEGVVRNAGYADVQSINPYHHGINGNHSSENYRRFFRSDVVGLNAITRTVKQTLQLVKRIKSVSPKTKIGLGGPHFTMKPEEGLEYGADVVCIGECEETWPEVIESGFDSDRLGEVRGIMFRKGSEFIRTPERGLLTPEKFVHPYYDEVTRKKTNIGVIEASRGCVHHCDQCQDHLINRGKYRNKPIDFVVDEAVEASKMGNTVFYTDNNIAGNKKRLIELSYAIKDRGIKIKFPFVQITSRDLRDPEIQEALVRMGIKMACVGYEHVLDVNLKNIRKPCSAEDNDEACRILRVLGIWNHGMIMTGGKDTRESLDYTLEWANRNLDSAQFFPICNLYGTPFDLRMRQEGRVLVDGIDHYSKIDGHNVVVRAENLSPFDQQTITDNMYRGFYSVRNNLRRFSRAPDKKLSLGLMVYTDILGGVSKVLNCREHLAHLEFLKSVS